jgi:hypothetical protein
MNTITIDISHILMYYLIPYTIMCVGWYYIITNDYERTYYRPMYICWACILGLLSMVLYLAIVALLSQIHINIIL